jgi:hypothetical protein
MSTGDIDTEEEPDSPEDTTRRTFLKGATAAAAGGSTLLAGCTGSGGDGGDGGGGDGGDGGDGGGGDGGGSTPSTPPGEGAIHFISMEQAPPFQNYWDKTASQFEEEHGTSVEVTYAWDTGYNKRIAELIQAGNPPDIINLEGWNVGQYVLDGLLADVTGIWKDFQNEFGAPDSYRIQYNDADRWFPSFVAPNVRWYRGDIMSDLGYSGSAEVDEWNPPATFDEFQEYVGMVDESEDHEVRGTALGTGATLYGTNTMFTDIWGRGGRISKRSGGEVQVGLGDYRDMVSSHLEWKKATNEYAPNTANWSWTEAIDAFANGNVGEAFYGGARMQIQSYRRERPWAKQVFCGPYMNDPETDNGQDYSFPSGWGITKGGSQTEAAKEYVSMIMMDEELLNEFYQKAPVHNAPLDEARADPSHPVWDVELVNEAMTDAQLQFYLDQIPKGTASFYDTDPPNYKVSPMFTSLGLGNMAFNYIHNDVSADDAIDTAISEMEGAL